jgi:hypothetical protein
MSRRALLSSDMLRRTNERKNGRTNQQEKKDLSEFDRYATKEVRR